MTDTAPTSMDEAAAATAAAFAGGDPDPAPVPAPESAPAPEAVEPPAAPAPADEGDLGKFGEHGSYIQQLRDEAAERRVALKPYQDAFQGYSDEQRAAFFGLAQGLLSDPTATAQQLREIADQILGGDEAGAAVEPVEKGDTLTRAEVEQLLADRESAAETERVAKAKEQEIISEAKELGYEAGSPEYRKLMFQAINYADYDLNKAHEQLEAEKQAIIDSYVEGKGAGVRIPRQGGVPVSQAEPIKTMDEARAATEALLRGL